MSRLTIAVLAFSIAGAAGVSAQGKTQRISKNLVNKAKDTVKEIEKVTERLDKTMKQQDKLLSRKKVKDRQKEHRKLQQELEKMEESVAKVRKKAGEMEKEADKFFTGWSEGLADIGDAELQAFSRQRYESSRARYAQIIGSGREAADNYEAFVEGMRNELSYLELDLSDDAIALLMPKTRETAAKATELRSSVDALTHKIEGYLFALE